MIHYLQAALVALSALAISVTTAEASKLKDYSKKQEYLYDRKGISASHAWTILGGKGGFISIIDIESAWNLSHRDLMPSNVVLYGDPPTNATTNDIQHGTAVLGILIADHEDGLGVSGIVPSASISVIPVAVSDSIEILASAVRLAVANLSAGDVLLIEKQLDIQQFGKLPVEFDDSIFDAIVDASNAGIIVIEAAGNGGLDLDDPMLSGVFDRSLQDSGATLVGAGSQSLKRSEFSNYGTRVDLQAWGEKVVTTGYGDLFPLKLRRHCSLLDITTLDVDPVDSNTTYTKCFGGTSSASAIVAGAASALQSIWKTRGFPPLSPLCLRHILVQTGTPQKLTLREKFLGEEHIGPRPNLRSAIDEGLTNEDGDAFPAHCECDDDDPSINPGAAEICNDGIDNDCDGLIDRDDLDCSGTPPSDGYDFRMLSFQVDGNILSSGAPDSIPEFFDNFQDGLVDVPPTSDFTCDPSPCVEEGGALRFREADGATPSATFLIDRATLTIPVVDGDGNARIEATFSTDFPIADDFLGLLFQNSALVIGNDPGGKAVLFADGSEIIASDPIDLSAAGGITLRLEFDDDTNQIVPSYRLSSDPQFKTANNWASFTRYSTLSATSALPEAIGGRQVGEGVFALEICNDAIDNNADGLVDHNDPLCSSCPPGVVICDDFEDNTISQLWHIFQSGSGSTIAETNGRLEITHPSDATEDTNSGIFNAGYGSLCRLRGDFDIQVDFELLEWPFGNGVRTGLGTTLVAVQRTSLGEPSLDFPEQPREIYVTHFPDGPQGFTATADLSGKLRQIRTGSTLTGYYFAAGAWVPIRSALVGTDDVFFSLNSWSHDQVFTNRLVRMAFDNFVITLGQLVCP